MWESYVGILCGNLMWESYVGILCGNDSVIYFNHHLSHLSREDYKHHHLPFHIHRHHLAN